MWLALAMAFVVLFASCSAVRVVELPATDAAARVRFDQDVQECDASAREAATPHRLPPSPPVTGSPDGDLALLGASSVLGLLLDLLVAPGIGAISDGLVLGATEGLAAVASASGWQKRYDEAYASCLRDRGHVVEILPTAP